jgi:flagellar protein FlaI
MEDEPKVITTKIDEMCELIAQQKDQILDVPTIASKLNVEPSFIEEMGDVLQENGVLEVIYPVNILQKIQLRLKKKLELEAHPSSVGTTLSSYSFEINNVPSKIYIQDVKNEARPLYFITLPQIGPYTKIFLDHIRDELARMIPIQTEEITDPRKVAEVRERFHSIALKKLNDEFKGLEEEKKNILAGILLHRMYGLGDIEMLMGDDFLEEIGVNGSYEPIAVYHRKFGWMKSNIRMASEDEIYNYASQIGRKAGRDITLLNPILDAHLSSGDRANATLFPISTGGNTITIRRFARNPWTIIDFVDPKMNALSGDMAAFLWLCIQYEINMLIVGGTASGKTSTLNSLCALIPPSDRIITIEDTRELSLPQYLRWNWIPLTTRNPNPEGQGAVTMLGLMLSALRMRPDRIIVGEIRKRREAEVLFEAMHTGHAVYSTVHADTASQVLRRLTHPPIELPVTELQSLQLILVQYRDRRKEIRRTYELTEVVVSPAETLTLNSLYRWKARTDDFEKANESLRVLEELNLHTGMTEKEIGEDVGNKKLILEWMLKNDIRSIDKVGSIVGIYYKTPATVIEAAEKNLSPDKIP